MQADLLRKDGRVLFMEVGSDFANLLLGLLQQPLGSVAGVAGSGCLWKLQESMSQLRAPIFNVKKDSAFPNKIDLTAMAALHQDLPSLPTPPKIEKGNTVVTGESPGPWHVTANGNNWSSGAAFTGLADTNEASFNITVQLPATGVPYMLGIAPESHVVGRLAETQLYSKLGYYIAPHGVINLFSQCGDAQAFSALQGVQPVPGERLMMRFVGGTSPSLEFSVHKGQWMKANFKQQIPSNVRFCPVLLIANPGQSVTVENIEVPSSLAFKAYLHPMAKFLITNSLEVCESSSLKAIQLLQQQEGNLMGLQVEALTVTPDHLRRMLSRSFLGHQDILQHTFGTEEGIASEGSEHSFVMTVPSG